MAAGLLLSAALLAGSPARAQNFTTGGGSSTQSGSGTVALNNAPNFDPAAAAAAALVGNYRVPGAAPVDPTGVYRVPIPDTSGGSAATTTTTTGTTTTGATAGGSGPAPSAGGASP
jgi:hypothetical protein